MIARSVIQGEFGLPGYGPADGIVSLFVSRASGESGTGLNAAHAGTFGRNLQRWRGLK